LLVMELDGRFLAIAANDTADEVQMTIKMRRAKGTILDVESGKEYQPEQDIPLRIPPYGYFAFTGNIH